MREEQIAPKLKTLTVIEAPRKSDLLIEFIRKLRPQIVVTGMDQFDAISSAAFVNLLGVTKDVGSRLFLDISEHLELSPLPSSNSVLRYLAGNTLPSHATILCGFLKNQVILIWKLLSSFLKRQLSVRHCHKLLNYWKGILL